MFFSGQLYLTAALLMLACQGALVPDAVRAIISDGDVFFANRNRKTMQDGANDTRACVNCPESKRQTNAFPDTKRKASDQLGSESPSKRVKNFHSETITPEAEGKPRVVPFPEKVFKNASNLWDSRRSDQQR